MVFCGIAVTFVPRVGRSAIPTTPRRRNSGHIRKISAWGSLIVVVTLVSGIYGMRFDHAPELHWVWVTPLC
jgi:hypothetical protein